MLEVILSEPPMAIPTGKREPSLIIPALMQPGCQVFSAAGLRLASCLFTLFNPSSKARSSAVANFIRSVCA